MHLSQLSAVETLRVNRHEAGFTINMTMVPVISADGRSRRVALYRLVEPTMEELDAPAPVLDGPDCSEYSAWMAEPEKGGVR